MNRITELKTKLKAANKAYRLTSSPIISDDEFDEDLEELSELISESEMNDFMDEMRKDVIINSKRKEKLPYVMASLDKVKTVDEIKEWFKSKHIPEESLLVITPKYDGLSLITDETKKHAWTSGDGTIGQRCHEHFSKLQHGKIGTGLTFGEAVMPLNTFNKKYSKEVLGDEEGFSNPRNLVSGQITSDEVRDILKDIVYIRYSIPNSNDSKIKQLDICNSMNFIPVPYKTFYLSELNEDMLLSLYREWSKDFLIDGIVVDIDDPKLRAKLGRHSSTDNPEYARAYKGNFEEVKEAKVKNIINQVSKLGYVIPVVIIEPTSLDGAVVQKASLYNYKNVVSMGIGTEAIVTIKRSGQVIPKVISVVKPVNRLTIPTHCPSCNTELDWNETGTHLVCENPNCPAQRLQRIISFFKIMKVEEVGKGVLKTLYDNGFDTIEKILNMKEKDFLTLPGFGNRSAEISYTNIQSKMKDVKLPQLMHASGCFRILGSRKLALVEHLYEENPSAEVLKSIKGYSEKSANAYIKGNKIFKKFIETLPVTIAKKVEIKKMVNGKYSGMVFVFTGYRNSEIEAKLIAGGGEIGSGVSKKTTHLVMKEKGSGSGKEKKAIELGIKILDKNEIERF